MGKRPIKEEQEINRRTYRRMRKKMAETHAGQWVGIVDGRVVATAPSLEDLSEELTPIESNPERRFVFQAGEDYLGLSQVKIQEALLLYQRGLVSLGRAAELAGLPEQEMARQARAMGLSPRWTEKMVEEELA